MSDVIQLLPDAVANQIAAGEVIQRPASVIKELVENAVDAGASTINVLVVDAGRTSIQVIDDGKGMSVNDARCAFDRHATSKIRKATDLFSLQTMGFRGEALPSIAAVAQVELVTRQAEDEFGERLLISASKVTECTACSAPVGSNFIVSNLFYNVPARRKFLKSDKTEFANVVAAFLRIALVYPDIEFTLHHNGNEHYNLKRGTLHQRLIDVYGHKVGQNLLPVNVDVDFCSITGYVGKPESAQKTCYLQFFFVNGRYMKHPYFAKAIQKAFERLVPVGMQVPYFIYFDVNPSEIDVNIHPMKTEIKFQNESEVYHCLEASVREAVGKYSDVPLIDFDTQGSIYIPTFDDSGSHGSAHVELNPSYNPFTRTTPQAKPRIEGWETMYPESSVKPSLTPAQNNDFFDSLIGEEDNQILMDRSGISFQYKGQFIVTSVRKGLLIVDQHEAHLRILYEQYLKYSESQKPVSQKILYPEAVQFGTTDRVIVETIVSQMEKMGFELTQLGPRNYAINAVPVGLEGVDASTLAQDMLADVMQVRATMVDDIRHSLALSMARKSAIPIGQVLSSEEMEDIITRLFECSNYMYAPDRKNIFHLLNHQEIAQFFS